MEGIIGEDEDIPLWEKNLFSRISDLSDLDFQKITWTGNNPGFASSFDETIAQVYDDFDFPRYIQYYESVYGNNEFLKQMELLDKMISEYEPIGNDELILNDPKWLEITQKAKFVYQLKSKYLKNC